MGREAAEKCVADYVARKSRTTCTLLELNVLVLYFPSTLTPSAMAGLLRTTRAQFSHPNARSLTCLVRVFFLYILRKCVLCCVYGWEFIVMAAVLLKNGPPLGGPSVE